VLLLEAFAPLQQAVLLLRQTNAHPLQKQNAHYTMKKKTDKHTDTTGLTKKALTNMSANGVIANDIDVDVDEQLYSQFVWSPRC